MKSLTKILLGVLLAVTSPTQADVTVIEGVHQPFSLVFPSETLAYGVEFQEGNRVFKLEDGELTFLSGTLSETNKGMGDIAAGDGGPTKDAIYNGMHDLALGDGMLFLADTFNNRIRSLDLKTMTVDTFAGKGGKGGFKDGPIDVAEFKDPYTVTISPDGKKLLIGDLPNRRVREINLETREVRTVAGNRKRGVPEDGALAVEAPLVSPRAAIYGLDGSVYIASREGNALRHVDLQGRIHTLVNKSGKKGYSEDGGPGIDGMLNGPKHLSLDPNGDIVIADDQNACVRLYKIQEGTLHLLAGIPNKPGQKVGDGPLDTQLNRPHGTRYDPQGRLWVCDSWNNRILCFEKD